MPDFIPPKDASKVSDSKPNSFQPPKDASKVNGKSMSSPVVVDPVKKKEETLGSPSVSIHRNSSLVTDAPKEQKLLPLDYSVSENKVFTGFPGKESNRYKKVGGTWYRSVKTAAPTTPSLINILSETVSPSDGYSGWVKIENEGSRKALNSTFGTKKPVDNTIGDKEKPLNSQNIKTDYTPVYMGSDPERVVIRDYSQDKNYHQGKISELKSAMDNELSQAKRQGLSPDKIASVQSFWGKKIEEEAQNLSNIEYNEAQNKKQAVESIANYRESDQEKQLKKDITSLVIQKDEEDLVPLMEKKYSDLGFSFDETGVGDAMTATSYRGKSITIDLQGFTSESNSEEAKKLRGFILENQVSKEFREKLEKMDKDEFKTFMINEFASSPTLFAKDDPEMVKRLISDKVHEVELKGRDLNEESAMIDQQLKALELKIKRNGGVMSDEMVNEYNAIQESMKEFDAKSEKLKSEYENLDFTEKKINSTLAVLAIKESKKDEEIGSFGGAMWNKFLDGYAKIGAATYTSISANILPMLLPNAGMNPTEYQILKIQGYSDDEILDISKKGVLTSIMPKVESGLRDVFGSETTQAYINSEDRSMFENAVFGLSETLPALISGGSNGLLSFLKLSSLSYAHVESEMMNNPEFANISESEKKLISIPYAIIIGSLEKLGFTKLLSKNPAGKSMVNGIIRKVMGNAPKDASTEYIEAALKREVTAQIRDGAFKIVGGAIVEGETGALQEMADIGIKEVYNAVKGVEIFETPDSFREGISQVLEGAAMESIGGGLLKTMSQSTSIISNGMRKSSVNEEEMETLMGIGVNPEFRSALASKLKIRVVKGELTPEVAQKTLDDYDVMMANVQKIPKENGDPALAYDLISEKQQLELKIKGKDPATVTKETERIAAINEELSAIPAKKKPKAEPVVEMAVDPAAESSVEAVSDTVADTEVERAAESTIEATEDAEVISDAEIEVESTTDPIIELDSEVETEAIPAESFESAFTRGTDSAVKWLDDINKQLDNFTKDTLGVNVPVVLAKSALNAAKIAAKTAKNVSEIIDSAITHVRDSDWYKKLSDADKIKAEQKVQRLFTDPKKEIVPPSKEKILGISKQKKVTLTERAALRSQIMMESKAAREGAKSEKDVRKAIEKIVSETLSQGRGKVSPTQMKSIVARALKMNLSNPVMAERFISYAEKVVSDVNYRDKLSKASTARSSLVKLSKRKGIQTEVKTLLKKFAQVNPREVEDIDAYMDTLSVLSRFANPTNTRNGKLTIKDFSSMSPVSNYASEQIAKQEENAKNMIEIEFPELFDQGILNKNMSVSEMREVISPSDFGSQKAIGVSEETRVRLESALDVYLSAASSASVSGIDPVSGEELELTENQKRSIESLANIDIKELSTSELIQIVDMVGNLVTNGFTGNIDGMTKYLVGKENAKKFLAKNGEAKKMNAFLRAYDYQFASLPILIDTMMTGVKKGSEFMSASGISDLVRGSNSAQKKASISLGVYIDKFKNSKPNGKAFNSAANTYERGMISFLTRNVYGTESEMAKEFNRRARIIAETVEFLNSNKASVKERKRGVVYKDVMDKLGVASATYENFTEKAAPENVEAVKWWINEWAENYDQIREVSIGVYNKDLSRDIDFTPDRYKKKDSSDIPDVEEVLNGAFGEFNDSPYNKESSVLMETNKPKILPKDRVIDLDFDSNNYSSFEAALIDISTAASIRQVLGFMNSEAFSDIFTVEDGKVLRSRINDYILKTRKKDYAKEDQTKMFKQLTNAMAKVGTSMALGGIDQIPKQTISVMLNTMVSTKGKNGLIDIMKKGAIEWIDRSGMPIAMRGIEAETSINTSEKRLDKTAEGYQKIARAAGVINGFYLKRFLSNPDKWIARASFIAYYKQNLSNRGLSQDIEYSEEMDQEAANYAQHMIDRQQNISDPNLAGKFFTNKSIYADTLKKTLFPFANFVMNQKSRMYSDIRTVTSKTATSEDKMISWRSLGGLTIEMVAFHAISILIRYAYKELAKKITGYDPDEEKVLEAIAKENAKRRKQGNPPMTAEEEMMLRTSGTASGTGMKTFWTSVIKDVFSPLPPLDKPLVWTLNKAVLESDFALNKNSKEVNEAVALANESRDTKMNATQENLFRKEFIKEQAFQLWDFPDEGGYGVLSIGSDKLSELRKTWESANSGTVTIDQFGKQVTKTLLPEDQEIAEANNWGMLLYVLGVFPSDVGKEARYIHKVLEKKALTDSELEEYNRVKDANGTVTEEQLRDIRNGRKVKIKSKSDDTAGSVKYR